MSRRVIDVTGLAPFGPFGRVAASRPHRPRPDPFVARLIGLVIRACA